MVCFYENENNGKIIVKLNTGILTNFKVKSINDVFIPARASNIWRGDTIRLGSVYVFDEAHNEILETIFQGKYSIIMGLFERWSRKQWKIEWA